ncbi:MFS transporter [Actinoplanes sp. G11-F43]|uniref:MFS transporter n=1 Tax=Actinoplanes sp. G11-F43 TaxID=3424130 RepID=UPI003D34E729
MTTRAWPVPSFRNLWFAQSVSLIGTQITLLAFPLAALLLLDASAFEVSLLATLEFAPVLLLGLPAGAWIEHMPRRPVMVISDLARAAALLVVPVAAGLDFLSMPLLYAAAFVIGLGTLFFDVAQMSALPELVDEEQLVDANSKLELSRSVAQVGGPGAGGLIVQLFSVPMAILVDAFTYLASALFLLGVKPKRPPQPPEEPPALLRDILAGMRYVFRHPVQRPLLICSAIADLAFAAVLALQVVFAVDELGLSAGMAGLVIAIGNGGGVLGAVLAGPLAGRIGTGPAFLVSIVLFAAGAVVLPVSPGPVTFAAGLFLVFTGAVIFNVLQMTLTQVVTPPALLGRTNSIFRFVSWGMVPVGAAVGGLLVGSYGLRGVFWIAAVIVVLSLVPPLFSPVRGLRDLEADEPEQVTA